ncbi:MAG: aminodeoxychorismate/anthranilate synthase component II [Flammeovirgaceae bacterium]|nr:aminodeoxychorismate/anthranilate synthase component II [Flammeovirgaceae bacterium]
MILLLDNFDSFTYNLVDYFAQLGVECKVMRNDLPLEEITRNEYAGIVLSPGPGIPEKSGNLLKVIQHYYQSHSILGICLGHQALGEFFGGSLHKAIKPMHGKVSEITCEDDEMFKDIPREFNIVRYHSLVVDKFPNDLKITAFTKEKEIMAMKHKNLPIWSVQYHPEAVLTEFGLKLLENWVNRFYII